jgi:hypothetical protein
MPTNELVGISHPRVERSVVRAGSVDVRGDQVYAPGRGSAGPSPASLLLLELQVVRELHPQELTG